MKASSMKVLIMEYKQKKGSNQYISYDFVYKFYNYSTRREYKLEVYIKAKCIDEAEKTFWRKMNGRDVKIVSISYVELGYRKLYENKNGAMLHCISEVVKRYLYTEDGRRLE